MEKFYFYNMMKECSPLFKPDDRSTWVNANLPGLFGKAIQGAEFNLSQSTWLWYLRECPPFKNIFTALHGTTDLCTSFDGSDAVVSQTQTHAAPDIGGQFCSPAE